MLSYTKIFTWHQPRHHWIGTTLNWDFSTSWIYLQERQSMSAAMRVATSEQRRFSIETSLSLPLARSPPVKKSKFALMMLPSRSLDKVFREDSYTWKTSQLRTTAAWSTLLTLQCPSLDYHKVREYLVKECQKGIKTITIMYCLLHRQYLSNLWADFAEVLGGN